MPIFRLLIVLLLSAIFSSAYAQENGAPPVDAAVEAQLDDVLNQSDSANALKDLYEIEATFTAKTPVMTRVRTLNYIALAHGYTGDLDAANQQIIEVEALARNSRIPDAIADVEATKLLLLVMQNKYSEALANLNDALVPLEQAKSSRVLYFVNNLASYIYQERSQFDRALQHLIFAADAVAKSDDSRTLTRLISTKIRIAQLYIRQKSYELALQQLDEAFQIADSNQVLDDYEIDIYFERASAESWLENFDAAIGLYQKIIARVQDDPEQINTFITVLNNIGDIHIRLGEYAEARNVLERAYELAKLNKQKYDPQIILFNLGYVDVFLGDVQEGVNEMLQVVKPAREEWSPGELESLLGEYAEALIHIGRKDEAINVLIEQRDLREQAYQGEQQKSIVELQNLYDSKDKALQIELLSQKNELNEQLIENESQKRTILVLLVIVALFAMVFVALAYRAARRSNRELKVANSRLAEQSIRDPLTGLLNRRALQNKLRAPHEVSHDAMLLLDVDHFKRINDNLGHASGDDVLIEVSKRLLQVSRESDLVVRWGGEEFLIYLSNTEAKKMPLMAKRFLDVIGATPIKAGDQEIWVTATAGFISYPFADLDENQMDWEETLQLADMVLYAGKVHGRNQAWGVMALNKPFSEAQKLLETDLPGAIEEGAISVEVIHGPEHDEAENK